MKIVIGGATGFIGAALAKDLSEDGHEVVALVRKEVEVIGARCAIWDGKTQGPWAKEIEGVDALVNLAGAPISLKWTPENRKLIRDSRIESTRAMREAIENTQKPPRCFLAGSAIGFYGDTGDRIVDESGTSGTGFLSELCAEWEAEAKTSRCRVVQLRTGIVLGTSAGMFPLLVKLTKAFVGGAVGSGQQFVPWIHLEDHIRMIRWSMLAKVEGAMNLCAPEPVTNQELMESLRKVLHRPWSPPAPTFALKVVAALGGPDDSLSTMSSRAIPAVAKDRGFRWKWPELLPAISDLLSA